MRPITYEIPKPLIPLHGKATIEHLFDLFKKHGVVEIMLAVGHMADKIKDYFQDGSKLGLKISYIVEDEPLGTAGPLALAKDLIDGPIFMMNSDVLMNFDIMAMYDFHQEKGSALTIATTTVDDPSDFGNLAVKEDKVIEFIANKPSATTDRINAGFYIIEPRVVHMIPLRNISIEHDIFPKMVERGEMYAFPLEGQWLHAGDFEGYEKAINEWQDIKY